MGDNNIMEQSLKIRAESIVDNPRLVRVFSKRKGNKKDWSLEKYYTKVDKGDWYLSHLSKGNKNRLQNIPAGSAYLNGVNAKCIKTDYGNVIAVSEPLEHFLYFMNIFFYGKQLGIAFEDRFAAFMIAQRTMAGHESFDFDLDPRGILPAKIEQFISSVTDIQYQFILGHEYSHHLLGHLDESKVFLSELSNFLNVYHGNTKIKHYKYSHKLEYDADWYSIKKGVVLLNRRILSIIHPPI